ncbi:hypothetical protein QBC46DRAFT_347693 [Diplogelasinospora grovesii]|uniref:Uncharacterized protein n=1 Tax=Diplogelasinospora grovesii TaxID=303347 RepID=A0AAN6MVS4_9PEZI|nr:hypothetical protein QBC46DRAFT_347693 [Diplogelasinospora grovesii]
MDTLKQSVLKNEPSAFQQKLAKDGFAYMIAFIAVDTVAFHLMKRRGTPAKTLGAWSAFSNGTTCVGLGYVGYCKYKVNQFQGKVQG